MDVNAAISVLKDIVSSAETSSATTNGSQQPAKLTREQLLSQLTALTYELEKPIDVVNRLWPMTMPAGYIRTGIESGLFSELVKRSHNGKPSGASAEELAKSIGAAPLFTSRVLRYLCAHKVVDELGIDSFAANEKTKAFAEEQFANTLNFWNECAAPITQNIPSYFAELKYQDVPNGVQTVWQKTYDTNLPAFLWLNQNPRLLQWLMQYMSIQRQGLADWLSIFPFEQEISNWPHSKEEAALFVDVGGSVGHQCMLLKARYPNVKGRIVLQDVPPVIEAAVLSGGVEKCPIDFFKGQPEKDARFYYLRNVLHDWNDKDAAVILRHIREAMGLSSEILIDEMVIPAQKANLYQTTLDMWMMTALGARERTLEQWTTLLDSAGLQIKKTYQYTDIVSDHILVAVPK